MNNIPGSDWYIKTRHLFVIIILTFILSIIVGIFTGQDNSPMGEVLIGYIWNFILFYLLYRIAKKASVSWNYLIGKPSLEFTTGKYILIVFPLIAVSIAGIYLVYYPLSFWFPELTEFMIMDDFNIIWLDGENHQLANALSFFDIAVFTPCVEEIFFRGFLLTSVAVKWGIKKGVIISSLVFGIGHVDPVGAAVAGAVLAIVYLNSKSLIAPAVIHISNNTIVFITSYFSEYFGFYKDYRLSDFQSEWWMGLAGLLAGVPWLIFFYRKEISGKIFSIPYFENAHHT